MTTSTTLKQNAKILFPNDNFLGVFSRDTLPKSSLKHGGLIVNTDTQNLPGTHWVAILIRENEAYYFDPFGYQPPLMIVTWLNKRFNIWTCNLRQVQPINSNHCGYFCLHFLYAAQIPYFEHIELVKIIDYLYPRTLQYSHYLDIVNTFIRNQELLE